MPRNDLMLVLDLECTGNQDDDDIIEIGCVLLSLPSLEEISYFWSLVRPDPYNWTRMLTTNPKVTQMHTVNGLIRDIDGDGYESGPISPPSVLDVDGYLVDWLDGQTDKNRLHIPLGGSGVSHFDRKYIKRDLPRFDGRLTHWAFDVGVLRRTFALVGLPWFESGETKSHRALDDARLHADEFRYAVKALEGLRERVSVIATS
jgi:oligoribonuclease (3'-5' exoribonuclease)